MAGPNRCKYSGSVASDNLVTLIADRVTGVIIDDDFNQRLTQGVTTGGLALDEKEADDKKVVKVVTSQKEKNSKKVQKVKPLKNWQKYLRNKLDLMVG